MNRRILIEEAYQYFIIPAECMKIFFNDHEYFDGHCLNLVRTTAYLIYRLSQN